jgi:hypothetical protein
MLITLNVSYYPYIAENCSIGVKQQSLTHSWSKIASDCFYTSSEQQLEHAKSLELLEHFPYGSAATFRSNPSSSRGEIM